jgi:cyclophilin family peptidyl-prolyl cis-trans isomerase
LAIANCRDTLLVTQLATLLDDQSPTVRTGAAFALGKLASQTAESLLVQHLLSETDTEVRQQTVLALAQFGNRSTLNFLLETNSEYLGQALIYYFQRQIYNPASLNYAVSHLQSNRHSEAYQSAFALSRVQNPNVMQEYVSILKTALKTADQVTRIKLVTCLASVNFSGKAEIWTQLLTDSVPEVRLEAARSIRIVAHDPLILHQVFNDSFPQVVATAIENLPDSLELTPILQSDFRVLGHHPSRAVRSALVKFLSRRGGQETLANFGLWPVETNLLPAFAEGIAASGQISGLAVLDSLSRHQFRAISTPAYLGLINLAEQFCRQDSIPFEQFCNYIAAGLKSDDPVKIAVAAESMRDSTTKCVASEPLLYSSLNKFKNAEYADAVIEILKTIAVRQPPDAVPFIQTLLNARDFRIRDLAYQILQETYEANVPEIINDYRGAGRPSNLKMLKKYGLRPTILLETERGNIIIHLDGYYAPFTTDAFLSAIERGFYNGLTFHRVVPNFVVQGGDPRGDGWGGPGYTLLTERSPIEFNCGAVGMVRTEYDTEGSQFFITLTEQPQLNYQYTRFGEVICGMDVVKRLEAGDRILAISVVTMDER